MDRENGEELSDSLVYLFDIDSNIFISIEIVRNTDDDFRELWMNIKWIETETTL